MHGEAALILIAREPKGWAPVALPVFGTYDGYGTLEGMAFDPVADDILQAAGVEEVRDLVTSLASWKGKSLGFTLVDAGIYAAIVRTVWDRWDSPCELSPAQLLKLSFSNAAARKLYKSHVASKREELERVAAFRAFGATLLPACELRSGQYSGLSGSSGTLELVKAAADRFRSEPRLLRAVRDNAAGWAEHDHALPADLLGLEDLPDLPEADWEIDHGKHPSDDEPPEYEKEPGYLGMVELRIARTPMGDTSITISRSDQQRVSAHLCEHLLAGQRTVTLEDRDTSTLRIELGVTSQLVRDDARGVMVLQATRGCVEELVAAFNTAGDERAPVESLPGTFVLVR